MSRPLRIEIENGIYHVTARGWERRVLVRDDRDREEWFKLLDLIRKLTSVSATQLAQRYGNVSQAAISKTVRRAETRRDRQRRWKQRLSRLEESIRSGE